MRVAAPLSKVDFGSIHCYVSYSGFHDKALYRYPHCDRTRVCFFADDYLL